MGSEMCIRDRPDNSFWALAGIGQTQLPVNTFAIASGGGVRVGLEDNIWYDAERKQLATNKDLLQRIHSMAAIFERKVMKPETLGNLGFYNSNN